MRWARGLAWAGWMGRAVKRAVMPAVRIVVSFVLVVFFFVVRGIHFVGVRKGGKDRSDDVVDFGEHIDIGASFSILADGKKGARAISFICALGFSDGDFLHLG